jgi:hypothetical protein
MIMDMLENEVYIQITHTSGIGDFYAYFSEAYFLTKELKEKNQVLLLQSKTFHQIVENLKLTIQVVKIMDGTIILVN